MLGSHGRVRGEEGRDQNCVSKCVSGYCGEVRLEQVMDRRPRGHGGCKSGEVREEDTWTQSKAVGQGWSVSEMKGGP